MSQMAKQEYANLKKTLQTERMKTNAVGAGGVLTGIAVGEVTGGLSNSLASGSSPFVKLVVGVAILWFNSLTGVWGLFVMGIGWGVLGSIVTDVVASASEYSLQELGAKGAEKLAKSYRAARLTGNVQITSSQQRKVKVTSQQADALQTERVVKVTRQ